MHCFIDSDASCTVKEAGGTGPMRAGYVIRTNSGVLVAEVGQAVSDMQGVWAGTINKAEYLALIFAVRHAIRLGFTSATVRIDSQLVARQLSGAYQIKHKPLLPLYREIKELGKVMRLDIVWERRENNTEADRLTRESVFREVRLGRPPEASAGRYPRNLSNWQACRIRQWFDRHPDLNEGTVARIFSKNAHILGGSTDITGIRQITRGNTYVGATEDGAPDWDKYGTQAGPTGLIPDSDGTISGEGDDEYDADPEESII